MKALTETEIMEAVRKGRREGDYILIKTGMTKWKKKKLN